MQDDDKGRVRPELPPEILQMLHDVNVVVAAERAFEVEFARRASDDELASRTDLTTVQIAKIRRTSTPPRVSLPLDESVRVPLPPDLARMLGPLDELEPLPPRKEE